MRDLAVELTATRRFQLADESVYNLGIGQTRVKVEGQEITTLVIFGGEETPALLGAYTLEGLGLRVDPVNRRLTEVTGFLMYPGASQ